jgi:Uma2 family endonuclease
MSTSRPEIPFTYEDYKSLTASSDQRYELIDGDLYMAPGPTVAHQIVSKTIGGSLDRHVIDAGCGLMLYAPIDVVLGEGEQRSVVQPDILFVSNERMGIVMENEVVGAPDLVIEILSPGTAARDTGIKRALYARGGVREYWIVDPALETVELFSPTRGSERILHEPGDTVISAVVPEFELAVADVFRSLP